MFLDKKTLLKIWLNPGLNLNIEEPGPVVILSFCLLSYSLALKIIMVNTG